MSRAAACAVCLALIAAAGLRAQESGNRVVLDHADSLIGRVVDGEQVKELIGNVQFTQGGTVVTCNRAIQHIASNIVSLSGEVVVVDSNMRMLTRRGSYDGNSRTAEAFEKVTVEDRNTTLTSEYGKYFAKEKKAYFRGNVALEDTGSVLNARELTYWRRDQRSEADGDVRIAGRHNRTVIEGGHFENYKDQHFSRMTLRPRLVRIDTSPGTPPDTLVVTSSAMESYQDSTERLIARDSVAVTRGEMAAEAGLGIFYTQSDSIILRKSPFVWYAAGRSQDNQVSGDSIFIKLVKRKLGTVHVRGDAFAVARADSGHPARFNQMSGQEITMNFSENKIRRIDVERTATSLYYLFDGRKPNGLNKASGDRVTIHFKDGQISKLSILSGPEGQYFPEKMVRQRESEFNLAGFNWRERRPGGRPRP
jgi:lipopolysaccharide export system protein LptA